MTNRTRRILSDFFLFTLALIATLPAGPIQVGATSFSTAQQVPTKTTDLPIWPSVSQDPLGRVWLAYANKTVGTSTNPDIFFKTWNGLSWSNPIRVTNDSPYGVDSATPFVTPLSNGSMMILWSSNRTGSNRYQLWYRLYSGTTSTPSPSTKLIRLTYSNLNDSQSSAFEDRNGRIWVAWARQNQTTTAKGIGVFYGDIYYKYFNGTSWSADFPLPQASSHQIERTPSLTQTKDGRIWVAWASNRTADGTFDLFYKTTDGTIYTLPVTGIPTISWSSKVNLCCGDVNADDDHPALLQARNGTIMVFWERCAGTNCLNNIFFSTSSNNGSSWTSLTAVPVASTTSDERFPTAVQIRDKRVWLFWQTQGFLSTQLWYTTSDPITNVHDVGITSLAVSPSFIRSGVQWDNSGATNVTVTVRNYGDYVENTTLTVKLNATVLATIPVVNLAVNQTRLVQFKYQTVLGFWGRYLINASVQPVPGENTINQGDNYWPGGPVKVSPPGDVDYNGCVNILDAALLAYSYGTTPGMPLWNPNADINHDGVINILDAALLAFYYGNCV